MDCSICCEKYNNSNHLKVECKGCSDDNFACRTCCQTFILSGTQDPMCMFCKSPCDRDFLNENLTKKFVTTTLKDFNENIFLERQISLLPDTQKAAADEKKMREINIEMEKARAELNRIKKMMYDQQQIIDAFKLQYSRVYLGEEQEVKINNFTIKCPSGDCNGFLDEKYFCSLCDTKYCRHCMEIKEKDHVCNEDTKATILAIKKESKPCPGCGEMISKIDGCDQMWCVKCHIQFSWRTGAELKGYNHNPEYFRWMRETGQHLNPNPNQGRAQMMCGVNLDDYTITRIITNVFPRDQNIIASFQRLYRFYRHVEFKLTYIERDENVDRDLKRLRVKYLLGDISRNMWKKTLQQIDKKTKKTIAYNNVWKLISTVMASYMEQIITCSNENSNKHEYIKILQEADKFKIYTNAAFCEASNVFGSTTCPGIDDNWRECFNYKSYIKAKNKRKSN